MIDWELLAELVDNQRKARLERLDGDHTPEEFEKARRMEDETIPAYNDEVEGHIRDE